MNDIRRIKIFSRQKDDSIYIRQFYSEIGLKNTSVSDPDPVRSGSGSVSGNVDMDPGSVKN